jgi:transitional endoplasmic reticulum ATPase
VRFIIRAGDDPTARADATLLAAMGLPGGGIIELGSTHCLVTPGEVPSPNSLLAGPRTLHNAGLEPGATADAVRAILGDARRVVVAGADPSLDARHLSRSLQGRPVTEGDRVYVATAYGDDGEQLETELTIVTVEPGTAGVVGNTTVVHRRDQATSTTVVEQPAGSPGGESPTTTEALLTGLDTELDVLSGWLALLTGSDDLPSAWGLPSVAGIILEGPIGCGKSELVAAAAEKVGAGVHEVSPDLIFKPEGLLNLLEKAVKETSPPAVVFVDRLDAIAGDEAMFRTQVAAILRWFLDAIAERPRLACVLGVTSVSRLTSSVAQSPLVPRSLSVPPPNLERRRSLFAAALVRVPSHEIDFDRLAAATAGFSGADIIAAVLQASALAAGKDGPIDQELLNRAIQDTAPSLGSSALGEIPSYGFDRVANLTEVKQRLTEAVIWQMREPERFERLGIEPPRGILLYGPPGTGKTYVIRALAHESGAAFFPVKGAELLDKWVGESERAVREVFARARAVAPAILFFDEIDALAPIRGSSTTTVTDSVVAALLTEMDGIADRGDVFIIGATNRRDLVDPALQRPGRLEVHLHLGLPGADARSAFFQISDVPFADDVERSLLVAATDGMSFADLSGLLREAALQALRRDASALAVTRADLEDAVVAREQLDGID